MIYFSQDMASKFYLHKNSKYQSSLEALMKITLLTALIFWNSRINYVYRNLIWISCHAYLALKAQYFSMVSAIFVGKRVTGYQIFNLHFNLNARCVLKVLRKLTLRSMDVLLVLLELCILTRH